MKITPNSPRILNAILILVACGLALQGGQLERSEDDEDEKPDPPEVIKKLEGPDSHFQPKSALQSGAQKPMPPQMVDYSPYEDVIELECEEKKEYLDFRGSKLKPILKVKVTCRCDTMHDRLPPEQKYEDLWFRGGTPIGTKQYIPLPIKERHQIAIFIKPTDYITDSEIAAFAGALVRLRLETMVNHNQIKVIRIPNDTLERMLAQLEKHRFYSYRDNRERIKTLVPLQFETDLGRRETVSFIPPGQ